MSVSDKPRQPLLNRENYFSGDTIVEQDSNACRAFYIEEGEVEIRVREGRHEIAVSRLGKGEIFGEMGLLLDSQRSATVKALSNCTLTVISRETLEKKIDTIEDKAIRAIIRILITRLRQSNSGQLHHYRNFAEFQERLDMLLSKADRGVAQDKKGAFREEAEPLLNQLEALLDKYRA